MTRESYNRAGAILHRIEKLQEEQDELASGNLIIRIHKSNYQNTLVQTIGTSDNSEHPHAKLAADFIAALKNCNEQELARLEEELSGL
jgi:hypothetical protein